MADTPTPAPIVDKPIEPNADDSTQPNADESTEPTGTTTTSSAPDSSGSERVAGDDEGRVTVSYAQI